MTKNENLIDALVHAQLDHNPDRSNWTIDTRIIEEGVIKDDLDIVIETFSNDNGPCSCNDLGLNNMEENLRGL